MKAKSTKKVAVAEYIDACVAFEHNDALRQKIEDSFIPFSDKYYLGYSIIISALDKLYPDRVPSQQKTDPNLLYGLLGFTDEDVGYFYEAASYEIERERYVEASSAFFFLVSIAPQAAEFWLDLGYTYSMLGQYQPAIEAYAHGIELAPDRADGYLSCAGTYVRMEDFEQAQKTCDVGLTYAKGHSKESQELKTMLEEAKRQIEDLYIKSKYGTFSS